MGLCVAFTLCCWRKPTDSVRSSFAHWTRFRRLDRLGSGQYCSLPICLLLHEVEEQAPCPWVLQVDWLRWNRIVFGADYCSPSYWLPARGLVLSEFHVGSIAAWNVHALSWFSNRYWQIYVIHVGCEGPHVETDELVTDHKLFKRGIFERSRK